MPLAALIRNRDFRLLWLSHILSTLAEALFFTGVVATVYAGTGSALQAVGVSVANTLPVTLLGPLAGVLVDRYPRQWVIAAGNLVRTALIGALLVWLGDGAAGVWTLYALTAGLATITAFYAPARQALLPALVPTDGLVRANSLLMTTLLGTYAIGFGLGGLLITQLGFQTLVSIDAGLFLGAALLIGLVRAPAAGTATGKERLPVFSAVAEGLAYLRRHHLARALITMETLEHVPHGMWTSGLMLVFTERALGGDAAGWGYQNSAFFIGQLLGALLTLSLSVRLARRPGWAIILNAFLCSVITLAYAVSPSLAVAIVVNFMFGPAFAARDVAQDSLLQATVESGLLGRVYATRSMLAHTAFLLAGFGFAWLAEQMPVRWVYGFGAMLYAGTVLYALSNATIRHSRIQSTPAPAAAE
jgi:MFS family permease